MKQIKFLTQTAKRVLQWCTMEVAIGGKLKGVVLRWQLPMDEMLLKREWLHEGAAKFFQTTESLPAGSLTSDADHL